MQRRTFVKGMAAASLMSLTATNLEAKSIRKDINNSNILTGNEFFLDIDYTIVNITGKTAVATTVNGQITGPTLVWQEGETVTLHVTNHLKVLTVFLQVKHLLTDSK
jgi:FtsP/CotA-like multicopper oxidase with cupredoxin domain